MGPIECPYCGCEEFRWSNAAQLYQCEAEDCRQWFEDDVPDIEHVDRPERTKLHREE